MAQRQPGPRPSNGPDAAGHILAVTDIGWHWIKIQNGHGDMWDPTRTCHVSTSHGIGSTKQAHLGSTRARAMRSSGNAGSGPSLCMRATTATTSGTFPGMGNAELKSESDQTRVQSKPGNSQRLTSQSSPTCRALGHARSSDSGHPGAGAAAQFAQLRGAECWPVRGAFTTAMEPNIHVLTLPSTPV